MRTTLLLALWLAAASSCADSCDPHRCADQRTPEACRAVRNESGRPACEWDATCKPKKTWMGL